MKSHYKIAFFLFALSLKGFAMESKETFCAGEISELSDTSQTAKKNSKRKRTTKKSNIKNKKRKARGNTRISVLIDKLKQHTSDIVLYNVRTATAALEPHVRFERMKVHKSLKRFLQADQTERYTLITTKKNVYDIHKRFIPKKEINIYRFRVYNPSINKNNKTYFSPCCINKPKVVSLFLWSHTNVAESLLTTIIDKMLANEEVFNSK